MHEFGIASSVMEAVRQEAQQRPGTRMRAVGLKVGEVAGVDPDALSFCFESLVQGTELEPLELKVELVPRRHRCPQCGHEFIVVDYEVACPSCSEWRTKCIGGYELELAYLELEEP